MENLSVFYKNIPNKECIHCGEEFVEQHECYSMECLHCITVDHQE